MELPNYALKRAIVILSGGIDSTTVLAGLRSLGMQVTAITFDYGQTLNREVEVAADNAARYGAELITVVLPLNDITAGCSLLNNVPMQERRSLEEISSTGTPTSYVPFRNGILFSYAVAYGEGHNIPDIFGGCNGLQSGNYYDDTREFAEAMTLAAQVGTGPEYCPNIHVPFATWTKQEIVRYGLSIGMDYSKTYSCYAGGERHCGTCDSCAQRIAAFEPNYLDIEGKRICHSTRST